MKILEKDAEGNPAQVYGVTKFPLMSEREMLVSFQMKNLNDGSVQVIVNSVERDDYPITNDRIRINMFRGLIFKTEGNGIRSYQLQ